MDECRKQGFARAGKRRPPQIAIIYDKDETEDDKDYCKRKDCVSKIMPLRWQMLIVLVVACIHVFILKPTIEIS